MLQLVNPMTDKIPYRGWETCDYPPAMYPGSKQVCFSVYHSCADVNIAGSQRYETVQLARTNPRDGVYPTTLSGQCAMNQEGQWVPPLPTSPPTVSPPRPPATEIDPAAGRVGDSQPPPIVCALGTKSIRWGSHPYSLPLPPFPRASGPRG